MYISVKRLFDFFINIRNGVGYFKTRLFHISLKCCLCKLTDNINFWLIYRTRLH